MYSPSSCPRCRWVCFFIRTDLEKISITSLAHQWILCSEWVPSEWEYKGSRKQRLVKKNILMMDLFFTNTHLFTSHDVIWWTGVMWITCGLLWCFYQLFGLSFWRHPFTAEDPLVSMWCKATFLQICSDEEINSSTSWMAWRWVHFRKFLGELFL